MACCTVFVHVLAFHLIYHRGNGSRNSALRSGIWWLITATYLFLQFWCWCWCWNSPLLSAGVGRIWQCFSLPSLIFTFILDLWANRQFLIAIFSCAAQIRVLCLHLSARRDGRDLRMRQLQCGRMAGDARTITLYRWTRIWLCWVYHPNSIGILFL